MNNEKKKHILARINKLLNKKDIFFIQKDIIESVELKLNVILPNDFKDICTICSYEFLSAFETYSFPEGVISVTEDWRQKVQLPQDYIVLGEDGTSARLIKTENKKQSSVIWCSLEDVLNLCTKKPLKYEYEVFKSFMDYYKFLLDEYEQKF